MKMRYMGIAIFVLLTANYAVAFGQTSDDGPKLPKIVALDHTEFYEVRLPMKLVTGEKAKMQVSQNAENIMMLKIDYMGEPKVEKIGNGVTSTKRFGVAQSVVFPEPIENTKANVLQNGADYHITFPKAKNLSDKEISDYKASFKAFAEKYEISKGTRYLVAKHTLETSTGQEWLLLSKQEKNTFVEDVVEQFRKNGIPASNPTTEYVKVLDQVSDDSRFLKTELALVLFKAISEEPAAKKVIDERNAHREASQVK